MTTDQKLAHIRWYIEQVGKSSNAESKIHWISRGEGALGAWFADMTIGHGDYHALSDEFKELTMGVLQ